MHGKASPSPSLPRFGLGNPFALSHATYTRAFDNEPIVIDTFAPKQSRFDLSPTSSASSDADYRMARSSFDAFLATRSRVVRLLNFPPSTTKFLTAVFFQNFGPVPTPVSLWMLREDYVGLRPERESLWAVFKTHEEACAILSYSGPSMSVVTALESDLEPFHKLRRFHLDSSIGPALRPSAFGYPPPSSNSARMVRLSPPSNHQVISGVSRSCMDRGDYTLSTNPPNPRTSFRLGDWICTSPNCATHNFGRNLACIGCGCPRSGNGPISPHYHNVQQTRILSSPRFINSSNYQTAIHQFPHTVTEASPVPSSSTHPNQFQAAMPPSPAVKTPPSHLLLTPSGRAFAVGGKVQNLSTDPLAPCVMYWPDNEALPEQGQIRPTGLVGIPQPPILNTGNRGPIEHQPGDWICLKCNYLNWRRRKVCQTCYPYAEGNGDSISSAVQAERIALLTSVLAQTQALPQLPDAVQAQPTRSHSLTPPEVPRQAVDRGPMQVSSYVELGTQYARSMPIYQTSGYRQPSPPFDQPAASHYPPAPAPLLPSFLQDIIQSPALSPASTSSADLSLEEIEDGLLTSIGTAPRRRRPSNSSDPASQNAIRNIWKLDGEETKTLSTFGLRNQDDLRSLNGRVRGEISSLPLESLPYNIPAQ